MLLKDADWPQISALRKTIEELQPTSVEEAAQKFAVLFADTFESIVLSRVFVVLPFSDLPAKDQEFARSVTKNDPRVTARTPMLSLLGTCGREENWNHRERSDGHLALPLHKAFVTETPMIAKLLADLEIDHAELDDDFAATTSKMLGSTNGKFYVPNADTALDPRQRRIIPSSEFVKRYGVHTVFGMGGSYFDGVLAVVIFFTTESLEKSVVDRFASFISTFKTITTRLQQKRLIYASR